MHGLSIHYTFFLSLYINYFTDNYSITTAGGVSRLDNLIKFLQNVFACVHVHVVCQVL